MLGSCVQEKFKEYFESKAARKYDSNLCGHLRMCACMQEVPASWNPFGIVSCWDHLLGETRYELSFVYLLGNLGTEPRNQGESCANITGATRQFYDLQYDVRGSLDSSIGYLIVSDER